LTAPFLQNVVTDNLVDSQITVQRIKIFSNLNRIMTIIKRTVHKKPHYTDT